MFVLCRRKETKCRVLGVATTREHLSLFTSIDAIEQMSLVNDLERQGGLQPMKTEVANLLGLGHAATVTLSHTPNLGRSHFLPMKRKKYVHQSALVCIHPSTNQFGIFWNLVA